MSELSCRCVKIFLFDMKILILFYFIIYYIECEISVENQGIIPMTKDDVGIQFYFDLKNDGAKKYSIKLNRYKCCEDLPNLKTNCDIFLLGRNLGEIDGNRRKRFFIVWPNLSNYNRKGACKIIFEYFGANDGNFLSYRFDFDTDLKNKKLWRNVKEIGEVDRCNSTDLDPLNNCRQENCLIKYGGTRSFFSKKRGECEKVPLCSCMGGVNAYVPSSNKCMDLRKGMSQYDVLKMKKFIKKYSFMKILSDEGTNIVCNNGWLDPHTWFCRCNEGWTSVNDSMRDYRHDLEPYHMCNIKKTNWNHANMKKIKNTVIIFSFLSVFLAMLVLVITLGCYKIFIYIVKKKRRKRCAQFYPQTNKPGSSEE